MLYRYLPYLSDTILSPVHLSVSEVRNTRVLYAAAILSCFLLSPLFQPINPILVAIQEAASLLLFPGYIRAIRLPIWQNR